MGQSYDDFGFEPMDSLCHVWHGDQPMTSELQKGLYLYAAAPELLEACKQMAAGVEAHERRTGAIQLVPCVAILRAAIAKAEGGDA